MRLWRWVLAFAAGYVLGTKAGRERYDQIMDAFNSFRGTEQGQRVEEAATKAGQRVEEAAAGGVAKVTDLVREKTGRGDTSDTSTYDSGTGSYGSGGTSGTSTYGSGGTSTSGY